MADKKKRAPLPPSHAGNGTQTGGYHVPVREIKNPAYVDVDLDGPQQGNKPSLPLPDYETLFPQKRHGVQGHTRWDHIIAEVNQRHREPELEFVGPEMSVDGPEDHSRSLKSSLPQESPTYTTHSQEPKPVSSKKLAAPAPPKSTPPPLPQKDYSQRQSQNTAYHSLMGNNPAPVPAPVNTEPSSRESPSVKSRDGAKKVLRPSSAALHSTRPTSQTDWDKSTPDDQRKTQVSVNKEPPTAKPRQRAGGKEPGQQEDSAETPEVPDKNLRNIQTSLNMSSTDKKGRQTKENLTEFDPFPSTELLSKDPWAQPKQNQDSLFAGNVQTDPKLGMTAEDLENIFGNEKPTDPFASLNGRNSKGLGEIKERDEGFTAFLRRNSSKRKQNPSPVNISDNKSPKPQQKTASKTEATPTTANGGLSKKEEPITPKLQADVKTPSNLYRGGDAFGAESSTPPSQPLPVVMEEPVAGGVSGGKAPARAWVSPSEVQPVSAQNSNGGGLALSARRPHPVKPMSTAESQNPFGSPAVKEIKVGGSVESGPYTQLTQEELITLVVKQQTDLSKKDAQIVELEEYIDNLLVRVIDEKPTILQSLNFKPV